MILNCDNNGQDPFKPYLHTPSPNKFTSQQYKRLSSVPQDKKSGLRAMPEDTERKAKERQGQNRPGKNLLPNFSKKIKVAPFDFTNHWQLMKINLFL